MQLRKDETFEIESPVLRPAEKVYLRRLLRHVRHLFHAGSQVLDAGCGDGRIAELFLDWGCKVTAVDVESHPAEWARIGKRGVAFQQVSAEALPFPDARFDVVLAKDAFHHMEHPIKALAELQRVAKPDGAVVVIEANRRNPVFYVHLTLLGGHQHFTRKALRGFLGQADPGFGYAQAESRCLPWDWPWILGCLEFFEETLEQVRIFNPWLTYQIGLVKGKGR
jgi:ubiquinone/menaquinone biosynthesis C-methylase UbiE